MRNVYLFELSDVFDKQVYLPYSSGVVWSYIKENPIINKNIPEGNYDSWLTIGIHDSNILGKISSIGIDFDDWDEYHGIIVDDGAVFLIDPTLKLSKTNKYIIGHLTLKNTEDHTLNINVQGLMDVRLKYNSNSYVENNILYNFKKKNVGH